MVRALGLVMLLLAGSVSAGEAPDFVLQGAQLKGRLSNLKNQVVYLDFWASWCSPCRRSFPWMNELQKKYAEQGLVIIAVNVDREKQLADEFLKQVSADFHIVFDEKGSIARAYEVQGMPSSYFIDRAGNVRFVHTGFYEDKEEKYEQELKILLSEEPEV